MKLSVLQKKKKIRMEKRDTQKYTFEESDKNAKVKVLPGIEPGLREGSNRTLF